MQFKKAPDSEGLTSRWVFLDAEGNEVYEIGVYPVIFGFRVRAGIIDAGVYHLDYCCRDDLSMVSSLLAICVHRLSSLTSFDEESVHSVCPVFGDKLFRNLPLLKEFGMEQFYDPPHPVQEKVK